MSLFSILQIVVLSGELIAWDSKTSLSDHARRRVATDHYKSVRGSLLNDAACVESTEVLSRFRTDVRARFKARADALFELAEALLPRRALPPY